MYKISSITVRVINSKHNSKTNFSERTTSLKSLIELWFAN